MGSFVSGPVTALGAGPRRGVDPCVTDLREDGVGEVLRVPPEGRQTSP